MKKIEEIEKMDLKELESISKDTTIKVPESLESDLKLNYAAAKAISKVLDKDSHERKTLRKSRWIASIAASFILVAGLGIAFAVHQSSPRDTYDDPMLAYAELNKVFTKASKTMNYGNSKVEKVQEKVEHPIELLNKLNN